jgi:hypothetical protein
MAGAVVVGVAMAGAVVVGVAMVGAVVVGVAMVGAVVEVAVAGAVVEVVPPRLSGTGGAPWQPRRAPTEGPRLPEP